MDVKDDSVVSINRLRAPTQQFRDETVDEAIVHPFFPDLDGIYPRSVIRYEELWDDLFVWGQPMIHGMAWLARHAPEYLRSGAAQNLAAHLLNQYCRLDWGIAMVPSRNRHLFTIMSAQEAFAFLSNPKLARRHVRRKGWWNRPNGESPRATLVSKFLNELAYHDARENYPTWESFLLMLAQTGPAYSFTAFVQFFATSAYAYETVLASNHPPHSVFEAR